MKKDNFLIKIVRNGFILAGLFFVSVYTTGNLTTATLKPVVVFYLTYIFTELARHYGLSTSKIPKSKKGESMIFA